MNTKYFIEADKKLRIFICMDITDTINRLITWNLVVFFTIMLLRENIITTCVDQDIR